MIRNPVFDLFDLAPHHSTLKWLEEELEVSEATADDTDEFDQKRLIHLRRLRDLVAALPLAATRYQQSLREMEAAHSEAVSLNKVVMDGLANTPGVSYEFVIHNGEPVLKVVPRALEYTVAMGEAGDNYIRSVAFQGKFTLPHSFRWHALWEVMQTAALNPTVEYTDGQTA